MRGKHNLVSSSGSFFRNVEQAHTLHSERYLYTCNEQISVSQKMWHQPISLWKLIFFWGLVHGNYFTKQKKGKLTVFCAVQVHAAHKAPLQGPNAPPGSCSFIDMQNILLVSGGEDARVNVRTWALGFVCPSRAQFTHRTRKQICFDVACIYIYVNTPIGSIFLHSTFPSTSSSCVNGALRWTKEQTRHPKVPSTSIPKKKWQDHPFLFAQTYLTPWKCQAIFALYFC